MHRDELWQVYAKNGEPIPGEGWRAALGNPEVTGSKAIVGAAIVLLYRKNKSGELEFLWQKRGDEVDRFPGYYDLSAGGHINLGESVIQATIREGYEEIGVKLQADELQYGFMQPLNENRFAWIFFVDWTNRKDEFSFNDKEVSEVKWVKYSEMGKFVKDFAKPPLVRDKALYVMIGEWVRIHGLVKSRPRDDENI